MQTERLEILQPSGGYIIVPVGMGSIAMPYGGGKYGKNTFVRISYGNVEK